MTNTKARGVVFKSDRPDANWRHDESMCRSAFGPRYRDFGYRL